MSANERGKRDQQMRGMRAADLRALASMTEELFAVTTEQGEFQTANVAFGRALGYGADTMTGQSLLGLVHPDDRGKSRGALSEVREGRTAQLTGRYRASDGSHRWISWKAAPALEQGSVLWVGCDVTDARVVEERRLAAERGAAESESLLEVLRRAQSLAIAGADAGSVFRCLLDKALELSGSAYGFVGEVRAAADDRPFLRTCAISDVEWAEDSRDFFEGAMRGGLEFYNLSTLLGAVMTSGSAVVTNDPAADRRAGGLPKGHPPLDAFAGLPLHQGDEMVGMLALANAPGGYGPGLVERLAPLLSTCAALIGAYQARRDRSEAASALRLSEERWRRSVDFAGEPVLVWDERRVVLYANDAAGSLLQLPSAALVGRSLDELLVDPEEDTQSLVGTLRSEGWVHPLTFLRASNGEQVPVELHTVDLGDGTFQGTAHDMREWVAVELKLRAAARLDNLTGLLNRTAIEEHAEVELQRARRRGGLVSLLLVDIDHFKPVNDLYGHLAGDAALQRVAAIVSESVRPYDWVGRWGGEEFLVVLPDASEGQATSIAERIRSAVAADALEVGADSRIAITVSVGIACTSAGVYRGLRELFEWVDRALYDAKEGGRNCIRCAAP